MKGFKDSVKVATPKNRPLNLSHKVNTSFDFYQFRPVFCEEMYPSEHMKVSVKDYFRASAMAGACYADCYKKYSAFFVPYRILWDKWCDYLTGGSNGRLEFDFPHFHFGDFIQTAVNLWQEAAEDGTMHRQAIYRNMMDLWLDLGIPVEDLMASDSENFDHAVVDSFDIPALRFLAVRRVWFDWYRDQNLIGDDVEDTYCPKILSGHISVDTDGQAYDTFSPQNFLSPLPIALEKDYFTTMMTEPQRGGAAFVPVQLPSDSLNPAISENLGLMDGLMLADQGDGVRVFNASSSYNSATDIIGQFDYNAIRVAKGLQRFLEKNNIAGGADLQQLLAHWGTAPNPAVFQKSTYIGSFVDDIRLSEVVSPSDISGSSTAGEVATRMNSSASGSFEYTANEHGFFMIVMIARPENTYIPGFRREVLHGCLGNGRFDFCTPELEATGMQPVYNFEHSARFFKEKIAGEDFSPNGVAGYVPRYAERKRQFNRYTGQMATYLNQNLRVVRNWDNVYQLDDNDGFINTSLTMVYGYPSVYHFDKFFSEEMPWLDHFDGWIYFDVSVDTPFHEYSAPLIQESSGDDITLPYAGVRM